MKEVLIQGARTSPFSADYKTICNDVPPALSPQTVEVFIQPLSANSRGSICHRVRTCEACIVPVQDKVAPGLNRRSRSDQPALDGSEFHRRSAHPSDTAGARRPEEATSPLSFDLKAGSARSPAPSLLPPGVKSHEHRIGPLTAEQAKGFHRHSISRTEPMEKTFRGVFGREYPRVQVAHASEIRSGQPTRGQFQFAP